MLQNEVHHPSPLLQVAPQGSQRKKPPVPHGETILVMQDLQSASPVAVPHIRQGPALQSCCFTADNDCLTRPTSPSGEGKKGKEGESPLKHFTRRSSAACRWEKHRTRHDRRNHGWEAGLICSGIQSAQPSWTDAGVELRSFT